MAETEAAPPPQQGQDLALLQAEQFFDQNPFAFFLVRGGGTIVRVNARFLQLTGFDTADVAGKQIEDLLSRQNVAELYGYHREKLRYRDRTFEYECNLTRKDGELLRGVITMNIVVQGGFCLGAVRDVTEERRLSAEVNKRNEELHQSAARLRAAQEELNRSTQMATLGEVSGRMAHEILNPLTAVTARVRRIEGEDQTLGELCEFLAATAEQLASPELQEPRETLLAIREALSEYRVNGKKDLAFILSELDRIQKLVDDMRGATRSAMARVKLSLEDLLQYCSEVMKEPLARAGISYSLECSPEIFVQADRGELIQVITNLIRNSLEALAEKPEGEPRSVKVSAAVEGDQQVRIRISDDGPGVPYTIAPMIFEPNFTTKKQGTGLGLAIARRLVRGYGGDLELTPPGAGGAQFVVTLPCEVEKPAGWEG